MIFKTAPYLPPSYTDHVSNIHMNGRWRVFSGVILAGLFVLRAWAGGDTVIISKDWDRNFINGGGTADSPPVRFEFTYVSSREGHLVGEFHLDNRSDEKVSLNSIKRADGKLWPEGILEVTEGNNNTEWKWTAIDKSEPIGKSVIIAVGPRSVSESLYVRLDAFKSVSPKATYGRVRFTDGRWAMFDLNDLCPSNK